MGDEAVLLRAQKDGVLTLTLNRPERRNALNPALLEKLAEELERAAGEPDIRALVLAGSGDAFCVGGDVSAMAAQPSAPDASAHALAIPKLLYEMDKPTLAMVRGPAAGAGLALALACDFRIATPRAKLTAAFAKVGLSGDFGAGWFLPRIVGPARAREILLLNPILSGTEALEWGLVTRLADEQVIAGETQALAHELAAGPSFAFACMKANLALAETATLKAFLAFETEQHARCKETGDHREAAAAFLEKRKPRFSGG